MSEYKKLIGGNGKMKRSRTLATRRSRRRREGNMEVITHKQGTRGSVKRKEGYSRFPPCFCRNLPASSSTSPSRPLTSSSPIERTSILAFLPASFARTSLMLSILRTVTRYASPSPHLKMTVCAEMSELAAGTMSRAWW
ncbi:hypothetical protein FIBSPDRAFT_287480 [Athelia psychrophila]|uniref:Uncharacterized protein n=1 Tax=Athelia psychrophila TaxID=1759441 RepID=A0A167XNJ6_9AGAM|nr:hypothetical protein FIBSPDRAFT_287480 [Fibularhizoctonia sp. CBS 109695]